jgi:hypothetical protein
MSSSVTRVDLGSTSRDRVGAPREPSWPRQRGFTRERDSQRRSSRVTVRRLAGRRHGKSANRSLCSARTPSTKPGRVCSPNLFFIVLSSTLDAIKTSCCAIQHSPQMLTTRLLAASHPGRWRKRKDRYQHGRRDREVHHQFAWNRNAQRGQSRSERKKGVDILCK